MTLLIPLVAGSPLTLPPNANPPNLSSKFKSLNKFRSSLTSGAAAANESCSSIPAAISQNFFKISLEGK